MERSPWALKQIHRPLPTNPAHSSPSLQNGGPFLFCFIALKPTPLRWVGCIFLGGYGFLSSAVDWLNKHLIEPPYISQMPLGGEALNTKAIASNYRVLAKRKAENKLRSILQPSCLQNSPIVNHLSRTGRSHVLWLLPNESSPKPEA